MSQLLTFDDVLIVPKFSTISSRKDVDLTTRVGEDTILTLPVISSNMDTVTGPEMAMAMAKAGGIGCLHRFASHEDNVQMLQDSKFGFECPVMPMVSIGLGKEELERAVKLWQAGASVIVIDVAHGAQQSVVDQANALRGLLPKAYIMVGNFASAGSVEEFLLRAKGAVDGIKVGVGPGSACTTRIKTGVGIPQFSAIQQIAAYLKPRIPIDVIADGGMKTPGDIAKALGAGANLVMLGGMLSGTKESQAGQDFIKQEMVDRASSSPQFYGNPKHFTAQQLRENVSEWMDAQCKHLKYRGSASKESYQAQGKDRAYVTAEGESFLVPYKGPVSNILTDIEGGIRSAMTYVGARTIEEFQVNCEFVQISPATARENGAHGKS